jgi:hypothetical protein
MIVAAMRKEADLDKEVLTANVHDARVTMSRLLPALAKGC